MKTLKSVSFFLISILAAGCYGPMSASIKPFPIYGQEIVKIKDTEIELIGSKKDTNIVIAGSILTSIEIDKNPIILLLLVNDSLKEIDFSTRNIRAGYGRQQIKVYSENEYLEYLEWQKDREIRLSSPTVIPGYEALSALTYLTDLAAVSERFEDIKNKVLRGKTIQPGETYGGLVMLQKLRSNDIGKLLILVVSAGSEVHEVRFSIIEEM